MDTQIHSGIYGPGEEESLQASAPGPGDSVCGQYGWYEPRYALE